MTKSAEANKILIFVVIGVVLIGVISYYFLSRHSSSDAANGGIIATNPEQELFNQLICDDISTNHSLRSECFAKKAISEGNVSYCGDTLDEFTCIENLVLSSGNRLYCNQIIDTVRSAKCQLKGVTDSDFRALLEATPAENKSSLIHLAAMSNSNPAYCNLEDEQQDNSASPETYGYIFSKTGTTPINDIIKLSDLKKDLSISFSDLCKFSLANKNMTSACNSISSKDFSSTCRSIYESNACGSISETKEKIICNAISERNAKKCEELIALSKPAYLFCLESVVGVST